MQASQAYQELLARWREGSYLESCAALLAWDERTYMPANGSPHRAEQMAVLARLIHERLTAPRIGELLAELQASSLEHTGGGDQAANVREIRRMFDRAVRVPKELVEELARVTTRAQGVWQEARQRNDFGFFRPWLEQICKLKREQADAIGYQAHPYDALLEEYEPGATTAEIARTFAALREGLVPLVKAIRDSARRPRRDILDRTWAVDQQERFGREAAAAIGFDFDSGRLDVTAHPFCSRIGPGDCRLTTHYNENQPTKAFFGTLHEAGHGIYEQALPAEYFGTPLGSAVSLGIHESQSRTWENFVGRSRAFWEWLFPRARERFTTALADVSLDDFYFAVNDVHPSLIRIEADEATYNLHIILRFELEQELVDGRLRAADVPGAWNDRFHHYLGLRPTSDASGCLQDVHWSMGGIGYFPTYALGNMYAAQFMAQARRDLDDLDRTFRKGDFTPLKVWLYDKVHRQGQRYRAGELCQAITGKALSDRPLLDYLRTKYSALYGL